MPDCHCEAQRAEAISRGSAPEQSMPLFGRRRRWRSMYAVASCLIAVLLWGTAALAQTQPRYPGAAWDTIPPAQSGWSAERLAQAQSFSRQIGSTAVVVVQHGAIVASWGDTDTNLLLNSARKSLLSALIGIAVAHG